MKAIYIGLAATVVLVGLFFALKPKPVSAPAKTITTTIVVKENKVASGPTTINAYQGDTVTIKITNDKADELHIHGYDKKVDLEANTEATISFQANLTGRFEYELEHAGAAIGQLQIESR